MKLRVAILALTGALSLAATLYAVDPLALHLGISRSTLARTLAGRDSELVPLGKTRALATGVELDGVYERQRASLRFDDEDRLQAIDVQVTPERGSDGRDVLRLYAEVKGQLLRRLGSPAWEQVEGDPNTSDLLAPLSRGEVIRYIEWDGDRSVRMGIPLRADGAVLIELKIVRRPMSRDDLAWGSDDP